MLKAIKSLTDFDAMRDIPERYTSLVDSLIGTARGLLEDGKSLQAFAFVGNPGTRAILPVGIDTSSVEAKERSAMAIKAAAEQVQADFVFTVIEVWGLPPDKLPQAEKIMEKYGSISACPFRVDAVSFTLETREGIWAAMLPLTPAGALSKRRTFGPVQLLFADELRGRLVGLLPPARGEGGLH